MVLKPTYFTIHACCYSFFFVFGSVQFHSFLLLQMFCAVFCSIFMFSSVFYYALNMYFRRNLHNERDQTIQVKRTFCKYVSLSQPQPFVRLVGWLVGCSPHARH